MKSGLQSNTVLNTMQLWVGGGQISDNLFCK